MNLYNTPLSYFDTIEFLKISRPFLSKMFFDPIKREFQYKNERLKFEFNLRVPILLHSMNLGDRMLKELPQITESDPKYLILLIRAGYSSLGTIENDEFTQHKVVTKYMVRKKQGKAQLTYLTTKGKARGGAKLRLAKSIEFFQEIRQKLNEWNEIIKEMNIIFYQCSPRLWNGLFKTKSKVPMVFSQKDERLRRIPITTYKPTFKEMRRVKYSLSKGSLQIKSEGKINSVEDAFSNLLFALRT